MKKSFEKLKEASESRFETIIVKRLTNLTQPDLNLTQFGTKFTQPVISIKQVVGFGNLGNKYL
jgi:hypothetical protein